MKKTAKIETRSNKSPDDFDFVLPDFESEAQFESWWDSLPSIELEFDERLGEHVDVSLRLNQRIVEGFQYLAKRKGLQQGRDLMEIVLRQYLLSDLPDDF